MKNAGFIQVASLSRAGIAAAFCGLILAVSMGPAAAQGTPEQQQACQPDAMRLCSEFIPDVPTITQCMVRKRVMLSRECKAVFGKPAPRQQQRRRTDAN
jgi:hypothetical protein